MSLAMLPLLLPASVFGAKSESDPQEWKPSKHLQIPQPPPTDDTKQHDLEMAAARQLIDGKAFKKVRPRRTVDYFAGVGRWTLVSSRIPPWWRNLTGLQLRKISPSPRYLPYMRPAAPYIIDVWNPSDQCTCTSISLNISCLSSAAFPAPPAESLPGKLFDIVMYQVCSHVDKQDSVSCELCCGEHLRTNTTQNLPLMRCGYCSGHPNAAVF